MLASVSLVERKANINLCRKHSFRETWQFADHGLTLFWLSAMMSELANHHGFGVRSEIKAGGKEFMIDSRVPLHWTLRKTFSLATLNLEICWLQMTIRAGIRSNKHLVESSRFWNQVFLRDHQMSQYWNVAFSRELCLESRLTVKCIWFEMNCAQQYWCSPPFQVSLTIRNRLTDEHRTSDSGRRCDKKPTDLVILAVRPFSKHRQFGVGQEDMNTEFIIGYYLRSGEWFWLISRQECIFGTF
jgi:hypothetical protein